MKTLLTILLLITSGTVMADTVMSRYLDYLDRLDEEPKYNMYLSVNVMSRHVKADRRDLNEQNMGFGLILETNTRKTISYGTVGYYKNSLDEISVYGGYGYKKNILSGYGFLVQAGVIGGFVSGYEKPITHMGMLTLSAGAHEMTMNLGYVPRINKDSPAVMTFTVQVML